MTISKQAHAHLEQLVATGLFGATVEDVMERLICEQLHQLLKERVLLAAATPPEPLGRRCSRCGSPRLNDISAMGVVEFQCLDCNFRTVEDA